MNRNQISGVEELEELSGRRRDYWHILLRRRWWILIPVLALGSAGVITARLWPTLYRSEALILVEHQKVPEQYVTPNIVSDLQYRLDSMTQRILSRTQLQQLIERFGLYQGERARLPLDLVIDQMRDDIHIALVQAPGRNSQLTAFRINYSAADRFTAQRVTNELTSLFIDQNVQVRTQQSVSTTTFLENQLEQARKELADQERQLREYKLLYLGELPEQEQSNLQILRSLEAQLQVLGATVDRAEQQKVYLQSMRAERLSMKKALEEHEPAAAPDTETVALEARLRDLNRVLAERQARYKPEHPDIISLRKEIAESEALIERLRAADSRTRQAAGRAATVPDRELADVESRLKAIDVEIAKGQAELGQLRTRIQETQRRLGMTPVREQQLAEVTRNYENSKTYYQSLLQKKMGSELATNLEKRQQGEQLRILDPATLPTKPSQPNRLLIVVAGWLVGVFVGVGLTVMKELMDTAVRSEADVVDLSNGTAVLVRIPVLRDRREMRRLRMVRRFEAAGAVLVVLLCVVSTIHTYLVG